MKNIILAVLILSCAALAIIAVEQQRRAQSQSSQLAETQKQLAAALADLKEKSEAIDNARLSDAKAKILQQTLNESTAATAEQSKKAEQLEQSLTAAKTNNPLHGIAAMFKDPKMRDMIKSQQKAAMGPIIDKQYSDLMKQLNLTPEQAATFKDLLQQKMLAGADAGMSMLDDGMDATQRAEAAKQIKTQTDNFDNQIKQFLGDDNYQAFQSYEKTVPDRMSVGQFNDQLAGTPTALTSDEQQQLIQAMSEARNNYKWTADLNLQNPGANGDMASVLTEDNINKFVQEREQFDQQFLATAQKILSPQQFTAFQDFQNAQRQLQITGLKMAAQMFAPQAGQ